MKFGTLDFRPVREHTNLLATPTLLALSSAIDSDILVSEIDPTLSDTAAFCEKYLIGMETGANCVIVEAKRANRTWYAACVILATTRADINNTIRRLLDARKLSFASMDTAVSLTGMEYGGITPIGLPHDWTIFVDTNVAKTSYVILGSGIRKSKLLVPGTLFHKIPQVQVADIIKDA